MVMGPVASAGALAGTAADLLGLTKNKKAVLKVVEGSAAGGTNSLEVMFNPASYTIKVEQAVVETLLPSFFDGIYQEYRGTNSMTFSCDLFFDEFRKPKGDVTKATAVLLDWMRAGTGTFEANKPEPPKIAFVWGGNKQLEGFRGLLTSCSVTYTVFRQDGTPVRADVKIEIKGTAPKGGFGNPTSRAAGSHRAHLVIDGDTLQSIAFRELGQPAYWRAIADLNGIDDPLRITAGQTLIIPRRADAAKAT